MQLAHHYFCLFVKVLSLIIFLGENHRIQHEFNGMGDGDARGSLAHGTRCRLPGRFGAIHAPDPAFHPRQNLLGTEASTDR